MNEEFKKLRKQANLTQKQLASHFGISLRSCISYEREESKKDTLKYKYMIQELKEMVLVDETHGILTIEEISEKCKTVFKDLPIIYCYLCGSYAKGNPSSTSNINLMIASKLIGPSYYNMIEKLHKVLNKKVEVISVDRLLYNRELIDDVFKYGIKIYG